MGISMCIVCLEFLGHLPFQITFPPTLLWKFFEKLGHGWTSEVPSHCLEMNPFLIFFLEKRGVTSKWRSNISFQFQWGGVTSGPELIIYYYMCFTPSRYPTPRYGDQKKESVKILWGTGVSLLVWGPRTNFSKTIVTALREFRLPSPSPPSSKNTNS